MQFTLTAGLSEGNMECLSALLDGCGRLLVRQSSTSQMIITVIQRIQQELERRNLSGQARSSLEGSIFSVLPRAPAPERPPRPGVDQFVDVVVMGGLTSAIDAATRDASSLCAEVPVTASTVLLNLWNGEFAVTGPMVGIRPRPWGWQKAGKSSAAVLEQTVRLLWSLPWDTTEGFASEGVRAQSGPVLSLVAASLLRFSRQGFECPAAVASLLSAMHAVRASWERRSVSRVNRFMCASARSARATQLTERITDLVSVTLIEACSGVVLPNFQRAVADVRLVAALAASGAAPARLFQRSMYMLLNTGHRAEPVAAVNRVKTFLRGELRLPARPRLGSLELDPPQVAVPPFPLVRRSPHTLAAVPHPSLHTRHRSWTNGVELWLGPSVDPAVGLWGYHPLIPCHTDPPSATTRLHLACELLQGARDWLSLRIARPRRPVKVSLAVGKWMPPKGVTLWGQVPSSRHRHNMASKGRFRDMLLSCTTGLQRYALSKHPVPVTTEHMLRDALQGWESPSHGDIPRFLCFSDAEAACLQIEAGESIAAAETAWKQLQDAGDEEGQPAFVAEAPDMPRKLFGFVEACGRELFISRVSEPGTIPETANEDEYEDDEEELDDEELDEEEDEHDEEEDEHDEEEDEHDEEEDEHDEEEEASDDDDDDDIAGDVFALSSIHRMARDVALQRSELSDEDAALDAMIASLQEEGEREAAASGSSGMIVDAVTASGSFSGSAWHASRGSEGDALANGMVRMRILGREGAAAEVALPATSELTHRDERGVAVARAEQEKLKRKTLELDESRRSQEAAPAMTVSQAERLIAQSLFQPVPANPPTPPTPTRHDGLPHAGRGGRGRARGRGRGEGRGRGDRGRGGGWGRGGGHAKDQSN
jgi:hypothetical protein